MKIKMLFCALLLINIVNAQTEITTGTLFEDSFEDYDDFSITDIGDWITLDVDKLDTAGFMSTYWKNKFEPQAFMVFNPQTAGVISEQFSFSPKTGDKYVGSWAAVSNSGGAAQNNDWLISPPIQLSIAANAVQFWVKSFSNSFGNETYEIGVYSGSGIPTPADFTIISGDMPLEAPLAWTEKKLELDAYANQMVRIGIHCVSSDRYFFMVDDFKVTGATLLKPNSVVESLTVFPNPATDLAHIRTTDRIKIKGIQILDIRGRIVKTLPEEIVTDVIDIADVMAGMYFISIQTDTQVITSRFLKR